MKRGPERTCIGCRGVFPKDEVVRIVAGSDGTVVLDYREKLPGRAVYVCPKRACIESAMSKEALSRSLKLRIKSPSASEFTAMLVSAINGKVRALIFMSAKSGKLAAGYSAVQDALEKGRIEMLIWAQDLSDGTREKLQQAGAASLRQATMLSRDDLGEMLGRELVGVIALLDRGLANAVWNEAGRLNSLINNGE